MGAKEDAQGGEGVGVLCAVCCVLCQARLRHGRRLKQVPEVWLRGDGHGA